MVTIDYDKYSVAPQEYTCTKCPQVNIQLLILKRYTYSELWLVLNQAEKSRILKYYRQFSMNNKIITKNHYKLQLTTPNFFFLSENFQHFSKKIFIFNVGIWRSPLWKMCKWLLWKSSNNRLLIFLYDNYYELRF